MRFLAALLWLGLFCGMAWQAQAGDKQENSCKIIARVFGQDICEAQLEYSEKTQAVIEQKAVLAGKDAEDVIKAEKLQALSRVIWEIGIEKEFGKGSTEATDKELESYLQSFHKVMKTQYENDKKIHQFATGLLKKNRYSDENREKLLRFIYDTELAIQRHEFSQNIPKEMRGFLEERETRVARDMIKAWKGNKLLYDRFGGGVAFQQAGLEPLEGYRKFLEIIRGKGALEIVDDEYENPFIRMDEYLETKHQLLPPDSAEVASYFKKPYWEAKDDIARKQLDNTKKILAAIPVLKDEKATIAQEKPAPQNTEPVKPADKSSTKASAVPVKPQLEKPVTKAEKPVKSGAVEPARQEKKPETGTSNPVTNNPKEVEKPKSWLSIFTPSSNP